MTQTKHTPEWTYEVHELSEGISAIVYDELGRKVADHLTEERAALIAAAPDLLEALKTAKKALQTGLITDLLDSGKLIDAAIAKAEGR